MKKKLLAVAVVGAFALPGTALAQSSVTISGTFKGSFESLSYGQSSKANSRSQTGVADDSSAIRFNVVEDLGGGLAAIGQLDIRFTIDGQAAIGAAGNTYLGLESKSLGRILMGRQDLHYVNTASDLAVYGALTASNQALMSFLGGGTTAIAGATRSANVVHYTTPNMGGLTTVIAYSANATGNEADIASSMRKGRAWNVSPTFTHKDFNIGYSYWNSKNDGNATAASIATLTAVAGDQRGDRLAGAYNWGGLRVGLAYDKSKIVNNVAGTGTVSDRIAWSLPVQYTWGNNGVYAYYTKARNDKATAAIDGAKQFAVSYAHLLSKRTSVALTYTKITNDVGANYQLFTNTAFGLGNSAAQTGAAGEDPKLWAITVRHNF